MTAGYEYVRTGPDGGWLMDRTLYAKCPQCGYYMPLDPTVRGECPCGNLYKDCGRFGANTGDRSIELYRRTDSTGCSTGQD